MSPGKRKKRKEGPGAASTGAFKEMTAAHVREPAAAEFVEVVFLESARFYKLLRANPEFERILKGLREAKEKKRPVRVMMETPQSNVIADVEVDR